MNEFAAAPRQPPAQWLAEKPVVLPAPHIAGKPPVPTDETLLRQFVRHTPAAVAMFDADMCCLLASDRWLADYGLQGRSVVGMPCHEMFPDLPDCWKEVYRNVLAGSREQCERDPIPLDDGSVEWLQWEAQPWHRADGSVGGMILFTQFITERIHIEEALRLSQDKFRSAMQHSPIGMAVVGPDGRWLEVNHAICKILGYSRGELLATDFQSITHPEDRGPDLENVQRMLNREIESYQMEKRYIHRSGHSVWVQLNVSLAWNPEGTPRHFVAQIQDITERRRAEEERLKLSEQLREAQKMEALGTLAGGTAHEFNNILGIIIGYCDLARLELPSPHSIDRHLEEILKAGQRAKEIVQQILTFTRQQRDQRELIPLHIVVAEALDVIRTTLPGNVQLLSDLKPGAYSVLGNPTQIHQVIVNLCNNAWQAMLSKGGTIKIAQQPMILDQTAPALHPSLRPGPYMQLTVTDNGCGMDAATTARVFEPFFTTKRPGKGTGLGLAVVHGIMQAHDGAVIVQSEPGIGTTFYLYFPAELAIPHKSEAIALDSIPPGNGQHILLVDDEAALAQAATLFLARFGYRVTSVNSADAALETFRRQPGLIDLVITDLTMPGMNGIELANSLNEIRPELPIILASGFGGMRTANFANGPGRRAVLHKPFTAESLARTAHQLLAMH